MSISFCLFSDMVTPSTKGLHDYTVFQSLKKLSCFSHSEQSHSTKPYISTEKKKYVDHFIITIVIIMEMV